jgi:hypothetical protein
MSERGSFVTEYIYCSKCLEAAKRVLIGREKYLCSIELPSWINDETLPIIAGKIGGMSRGEELVEFECEIGAELEASICHPLRVAVLAEVGERIFTFEPAEPKNSATHQP